MLIAGGGAATAAIRFDANRSDEALKGIRVGGLSFDGMDFKQARSALIDKYSRPLERAITVEVDGQSFETTPRKLGMSTNALSVYEQAVSLHSGMPMLQRTWHRVTGIPVDRKFEVKTSLDARKAQPFIEQISKKVDRAPKDAAVSATAAGISISKDAPGFALDKPAAALALKRAALKGDGSIALPGKVLPAATKKDSISNVLVLKVGENRLFHYRGEQLAKIYDVATGTDEYPTPKGQFKIVNKRFRPTWVNPAKHPGGWGAKLPARIPPGPGNPLGTRAMDLNARGIRIHGTYAERSIGYNASHGCIRMRIAEAEELFELVGVGTPVIIMQSGPNRPAGSQPRSAGPEALAESDGSSVPGLGQVPQPPAPFIPPSQPVPVPIPG